MYYFTKYFSMYRDDTFLGQEFPPMIYFDISKTKASLKYFTMDNSSLVFSLGLFKFHFVVEFSWNFIEREMTEKEKERKNKFRDFVKELEGTKHLH